MNHRFIFALTFSSFLFGASCIAQSSLELSTEKNPASELLSKNPLDQEIEADRGGRGLITVEGPSGLFLNPTSGTLQKGDFTLQACSLLPEASADSFGVSFLVSYGITDWLEFGAIGTYAEGPEGTYGFAAGPGVADERFAAGPMARVRLAKQEGWRPEMSLGAYAKFGDKPLQQYTGFFALSYEIPVNPDGPLRSVRVHSGYRGQYSEYLSHYAPIGFGGLELELPYNLYLIGEISTQDDEVAPRRVPYAFGVQWKLPVGGLTLAGVQTGNSEELALYAGVGISFGF